MQAINPSDLPMYDRMRKQVSLAAVHAMDMLREDKPYDAAYYARVALDRCNDLVKYVETARSQEKVSD